MAHCVRQADRDEVAAVTGGGVVPALVTGVLGSTRAYTVKRSGRPIAIFGVADMPEFPAPTRYGAVWMLGTDEIAEVYRPFLRGSRLWLPRLEEGYDMVGNLVDARNLAHVRYLRWLGFGFPRVHKSYGHEGRPFLEFVKLCATPQQPS